MDKDKIARRYPWTVIPNNRVSNRASDAERIAWHEAHLYRVTWTVPDGRAGLYGWRSEQRMFDNEAAARAAAEAPMGVASSVCLDVSNNGWKNYLPDAQVTTLYKRNNPAYTKRRAA